MNKYVLCSTDNILNTNYKNLTLWATSIGKITQYLELSNIFNKSTKQLKPKLEITDDILKYMVDDNKKIAKNKILIYTNNINDRKFMTLMNDIL